ncbi:multicopper oxidase domain-containing protein [Keguizhuia sedimenti]|uniref:multicopper oxidase domain-containing protein n=1 Tax=Keguizhuia sedimenti TaxID=3064264 RepID=UPI003BB00D38
MKLLPEFTQPASADAPFMYHCHILEHENAGMMGQFLVSRSFSGSSLLAFVLYPLQLLYWAQWSLC